MKKEMTFLEHLEDLRWHIIRSLMAILIVFIVVFFSKKILFDYIILYPMQPNFFTYKFLCNISNFLGLDKTFCIEEKLFLVQNINLSGQFLSHIWISFVFGLIVTSPYIIFEFWKFIKPALKKEEKKKTVNFVFWTSILFLLGVFFGYYFLVPVSINFLGTYQVSELVTNQISLNSYVNTVSVLVLSAGIMFEIPIFAYFLSYLGLISYRDMKKYRRHAIVIVLIISSILTPPDIFSQVLLSLPILLLYEISIIIIKKMEKKLNKNDIKN